MHTHYEILPDQQIAVRYVPNVRVSWNVPLWAVAQRNASNENGLPTAEGWKAAREKAEYCGGRSPGLTCISVHGHHDPRSPRDAKHGPTRDQTPTECIV